HIKADRQARQSSTSLQHTYTISFVPHRTEPCLQLLDQEQVLSDVTLLDFGLEFIPLEKDLISLEDDNAWRHVFSDGDHTALFRSAQALMTLQHVYGLFPRIVGKGNLAKRLADLLIRQRREHLASDPSNPALTVPSQSVDSLIIIDRSVDLATPLCTQLTYEGLIDEVIGIKNAHVEVDPSLLSSSNSGAPTAASGSGTPLQMTSVPRKKKQRLDSTADPLFPQVRDENFAVVGEKLHRIAKRINEDYDGRHNAKTVQQIRAFVGKLGNLQSQHASLRLHTGLTEQIMGLTGSEEFNRALEIQQNLVAGLDVSAQQAAIEDLINYEAPLLSVLRLLCLSSVVAGGIKPKNLEFVKREILQTYGYEHLPLLLALSKVGLLQRITPTSNRINGGGGGGGVGGFSTVRRSLKLINDDVDEKNPTDVSYVYSGYAPLSIRLVQAVAQKEALLDPPMPIHASSDQGGKTNASRINSRSNLPRAHPIVGWRGFEDVVNSLPGYTFDEIQGGRGGSSSGGGLVVSNLGPMGLHSNGTTNKGQSSGGVGSAAVSHQESADPNKNEEGKRIRNLGHVHQPLASTTTTTPWSDPDSVKTTIVFFLGGVTFTEVAALRLMSRQTTNRRYLVATTNTLNGNTILSSLDPRREEEGTKSNQFGIQPVR
ncbi:Sec1-like protein, partial [Violaceomyces palustris]